MILVTHAKHLNYKKSICSNSMSYSKQKMFLLQHSATWLWLWFNQHYILECNRSSRHVIPFYSVLVLSLFLTFQKTLRLIITQTEPQTQTLETEPSSKTWERLTDWWRWVWPKTQKRWDGFSRNPSGRVNNYFNGEGNNVVGWQFMWLISQWNVARQNSD